MEQRIIQVNKGIANVLDNGNIEIHKNLYKRKYHALLCEIIIHELSHEKGGWTVKDFLLDLKGFNNRSLYWKFVCSNPSSWWQFLPAYKASDKKVYWDISLMLTYGFGLIITGGFLWIVS